MTNICHMIVTDRIGLAQVTLENFVLELQAGNFVKERLVVLARIGGTH